MSRQLGVIAVALIAPVAAFAQPGDRVIAARSTSPAAAFATRVNDGEFRVLPTSADLVAGDLLLTLPGAGLKSKNSAVGLKSLADYDGRSDHPIFETAFALHDAKDADLDLTLDRGRVEVSNARSEGGASVRVRFRDQSWKIALDSPGSRVAVELDGRWPPGSRFKPIGPKDTGKPASPYASFALLLLNGTAAVDVGGLTLGLKPTPGPARLEWDSIAGPPQQPVKVEKLPSWADATATPSPEARKLAEAVERFRAVRAERAGEAIEKFLESSDPVEQRIALITLGATDNIDRLARQMAAAKSLDEWDFGITVLRHWLGRCPEQDQKLYAALISPVQGYTSAHARIVLQLLLGFDPADATRPETYEVLIEYLQHDKAAIRNLAVWHLVRLVPPGKAIEFKPSWTRDECKPVYAAWKKMIPTGQLPPQPKKP
jgi:hypothetical protein